MNGSKIVTPLPRPWVSLPVGSRTSPAALTIVPRLERVEEGVLHRNGDVSEPSLPFARGAFLKGEGHDHFELTARAETPLVEQHVLEGGFIAARDRRRQDRLVFGKRLLGDEGAREVQLAARPRAVGAQVADVSDRLFDLLVREHLAKCRHPAIERADRPALVRDDHPVRSGLRCGEAAVGEVGERRVEADRASRLTLAVRTVARGAGRAKDLLSVLERDR